MSDLPPSKNLTEALERLLTLFGHFSARGTPVDDRKVVAAIDEITKQAQILFAARGEYKNFLVFSFDHYYPAGGWSDFRKAFTTPWEGTAFAETLPQDCAQVVDLTRLEGTWVKR